MTGSRIIVAPRSRARAAAVGGVMAVAAATGGAAGPSISAAGSSAPAQSSDAAATRWPAFGAAHVDVMDLHVARLSNGDVVDRELLPAADLGDRYARAVEAGVAWNRWSLYWDMVERREGALDWSAADGIVGRDVAAGLRTLAILQGTPPFVATGGLAGVAPPPVGGLPLAWQARGTSARPSPAVDRSRAPVQASPPRGLDQPIFRGADGSPTDDPGQAVSVNAANPWARFVDAAVTRYRPEGTLARARGWPPGGGVRAWEIGNEPNLAHFWSGSEAQFARYLEVAYLVIHWRDPAAIVVHGGIADDAGAAAWYGRFADALKARARVSPLPARHGYYFDKAGWHWYTYPSLLQTGPARARALLAERGLPAKPIWVTEMGVPIWSEHPGPCWDPVSPWRASAPEQAGYVWQSLAEGAAAGVEAMLYFQLYDDCGNGPDGYDAFGLVRNHASNQCWTDPRQGCWRFDAARAGTPRPAYEALRVAARELAGAELLWRPPRDPDFWQRVLFYQPPDRRVMVLWNLLRAERTVDVYATGPQAVVHTLGADGALISDTAAPTAGRHRLTLPGATNRNNPDNRSSVMGGLPVIVVERDTAAPFRALVEPLPAASAPRFELTVAAADGGTGVGAYRVLVATAPPRGADDWRPLGEAASWPAPPLAGSAKLAFEGAAGTTYYFAAQAQDRAGNWSAAPAAAQAQTYVTGNAVPPTATDVPSPTAVPPAGTVPTAGATPTSVAGSTTTPTSDPTTTPAAEPTPLPTPEPTASPTPAPTVAPTDAATETPTVTPLPSATRTSMHVVAKAFLPLALGATVMPGTPGAPPTPAIRWTPRAPDGPLGPRGSGLVRPGARATITVARP